MFKFIFILSLLAASLPGFASPFEQTMTIKERLRLSLWVEGIQSPQPKVKTRPQPKLPEEIERPLRNL